jgi:hypothetical protein
LRNYLVAVALAAAALTANADSFTADVAIFSRGSYVMIAVDRVQRGGEARRTTDGFVDDVFMFGTVGPRPAINTVVRNAHVEFAQRHIAVISSEERRLFSFALLDATDVPNYPDDFTGVRRTDGFQVSHRLFDGSSSVTLDELIARYGNASAGPAAHRATTQTVQEVTDWEDEFRDASGGSSTTTCSNGGPGATQCSMEITVAGTGGSCSVSCAAGYYACCNSSGCKCVKG